MQREDILPASTSVQCCRVLLLGVKKLEHHISLPNLTLSGLKMLAMSNTATRGLRSSRE